MKAHQDTPGEVDLLGVGQIGRLIQHWPDLVWFDSGNLYETRIGRFCEDAPGCPRGTTSVILEVLCVYVM